MKRAIAVLLLLLFVVCSCNENPVRPMEYGQGDDYDIYQTVLNEDFDSTDALIILRDSTSTSIGNLDTGGFSYFINNLPGLTRDVIGNFISANGKAVELDYIQSAGHLVLSRDYTDRWERNTVRVTLSRIGYDSTKTRAIVELGELWAPLDGSGSLIFLMKENGSWKIKARCMTWIS